jgi:nucleoside-diphosphate-sugar epimerase
MSASPKLLVTGCNGFIGRKVASIALARGMKLTGLSLHAPAHREINRNIEYLIADISNADALAQVIGNSKFDYVINCSGYIDHTPISKGGGQQFKTHFTGLLNLIRSVNHDQLKGFVQIGTSDEYGNIPSPQHEALREAPISPYACAKVAASHLVQMLHRTEGFPGCIARLFLVYGPGQNLQRFTPQIITGCLKNTKFPVSAGEQIRDFCYIDDIADALVRLVLDERTHGEIFNVASGNGVSIKSMIEIIQHSIGSGKPIFGKVPYRTGENMSLVADINKITAITGWHPTTPLEKGIERTVKWYHHQAR